MLSRVEHEKSFITSGPGAIKFHIPSTLCISKSTQLSRLRLSRITAYLEEKSDPCFNIEI